MLIKKVELTNIRSYKKAEIVFPSGNTILSGDIGSGKTTVLLAIEFALFGLQPGQRGSALLRHGENDGSVTLEIEIDGKEVKIERILKRGKSVNQGETFITTGNEKKEMSINESKNLILQLLNYPKEFVKKTNILYKFTVYTPQEEMKQIILEKPDVRLDTLRHIFGVDKYKKVEENAEIFTAKLRENIRNFEGRIENLEEVKKNLEAKKKSLEILEKEKSFFKDEFEKKKKERGKFELELKEVEEKLEEKRKFEQEAEKMKIMAFGKKEMLFNFELEIKKSKKQIEEILKVEFDEKKLEEMEKNKKEKITEQGGKNQEYLEIFGEINSLKNKVKEENELKKQVLSLKFCPTCLQGVTEEHKQNVIGKSDEARIKAEKRIKELEEKKKSILERFEKLKSESEELDKKIAELKIIKVKLEGVEEKKSRILELEKQEKNLRQDIEFLERQILSFKESASQLKKYEGIYEARKKELSEKLSGEKETEIKLAEIEKEREIINREIIELEEELKLKEKIKKEMMYSKELEDWISNWFLALIRFTERNIMLRLREEFSKLFNEWFNILVPDIFTARLNEDFTPIIEQQDYQLDYSFLSGGERTAVALAYRLALNQTINSLLSKIKTKDLVILDEPTEGFSEQQLDKMRDILHELKVRQLIIVSHETKIESFVENIIRFKKEGGLSRVLE